MACCTDGINPRELDVTGDIYEEIIINERGQDVGTLSILYNGVRSKQLAPLRTQISENYEFNQEVAIAKNSWLIRNESSRNITPNRMKYFVDGEYHEIQGVRKYKGGRKYLVLDTILRDNQTN